MEKENINVEIDKNEFNDISQKMSSLKNKIEDEINNVNRLYEKTIDDIRKSFIKKHEELIKEENDLKEELQKEVIKIKEGLEIFLLESKKEIEISERLNKGIKRMEKEENNIIKILSYVSKINKTQKNMKKLLYSLMKNIKFNYDENKNHIIYEEYYFNGNFILKNIEFKNISSDSINISWKLDNINSINNDKFNIKYKVEMRKENEKFIKIYEDSNNNCYIDNLEMNTNYEFRICLINNDIIGEWSQIYKMKTLNLVIDSIILKESKREKELLKIIQDWIKIRKMELIYRGTRDGESSNDFHNKCDNQGATIVLCKNENDNIFGGYTSYSWGKDEKYHNAPDSFLFTLTNIYNINPTKFPSKNDQYDIYHNSNHGPVFGSGNDLFIYNNFLKCGGLTYFPSTYEDNLGKGKSIFTGKDNNNDYDFKIKEIEIFKIFK